LSWRICKLVAFPIQKWRQNTSHKLNGLSLSIELIVPAISFVKGLPDLGSSNKFLLPLWKQLRHFFTVNRASASEPYTYSSSAWIALAFSPLSVKKQIAARCSREILSESTSFKNLTAAEFGR
jgi:hypothetical protein